MEEEEEPQQLSDDIITATNRLLLANKINIRNCFDINIADISSLKPYSRLDQGENWQRVSTHLSSQARIYSIKVESLHDDTSKLVNEYNRFSEEINVRKEPTRKQLDNIRSEIESRLSYNPAKSNLDPSLRNEVMVLEAPPPNLRMMSTKGLLLDTLELSHRIQLRLAQDFEDEQAQFQEPMSSLPALSTSMRELTIFKEIAAFNSELLDLADDLQVQLVTKLDSDMPEIENGRLSMDFDQALFKPDYEDNTRGDMSFSMQGSSDSTVMDWSRNVLQNSEIKSSEGKALLGSSRLTDLINESRSVGKLDNSSTTGPGRGKSRRNRTRPKQDFPPIEFEPEQQLSRLFLKPIKLRGLYEVHYNTEKLLVPKVFIVEHQFGQGQEHAPVLQQMEADQRFQTPFQAGGQPADHFTTGHGQHRGIRITRIKEILLDIIKRRNYVTDLKTIIGSMQQKPQASDMPFIFSALLHIAVEEGLNLAYGNQNIYLQRLV